jgi:hypothetical protein
MVSIWLTTVKARANCSGMKKTAFAKRSRFSSNLSGRKSLLAILLDPGGPQTGQAMLIDRKLPGEELVDRQRVTAAGFLEGKQAASDRCDDFGLAADNPPFGARRGQVGNC